MDSQFAEVKSSFNGGGPIATGNGCSVFVPYNLLKRKIYFYLWVSYSGDGTDYGIMGTVQLINAAGEVIGKIPVAAGVSKGNGFSSFQQSLVSFISCGGSPVQDTLSLILCNPVGNQPTYGILMQPFYVDAPCSQVRFVIDKILNIIDARYYLAVVSN